MSLSLVLFLALNAHAVDPAKALKGVGIHVDKGTTEAKLDKVVEKGKARRWWINDDEWLIVDIDTTALQRAVVVFESGLDSRVVAAFVSPQRDAWTVPPLERMLGTTVTMGDLYAASDLVVANPPGRVAAIGWYEDPEIFDGWRAYEEMMKKTANVENPSRADGEILLRDQSATREQTLDAITLRDPDLYDLALAKGEFAAAEAVLVLSDPQGWYDDPVARCEMYAGDLLDLGLPAKDILLRILGATGWRGMWAKNPNRDTFWLLVQLHFGAPGYLSKDDLSDAALDLFAVLTPDERNLFMFELGVVRYEHYNRLFDAPSAAKVVAGLSRLTLGRSYRHYAIERAVDMTSQFPSEAGSKAVSDLILAQWDDATLEERVAFFYSATSFRGHRDRKMDWHVLPSSVPYETTLALASDIATRGDSSYRLFALHLALGVASEGAGVDGIRAVHRSAWDAADATTRPLLLERTQKDWANTHSFKGAFTPEYMASLTDDLSQGLLERINRSDDRAQLLVDVFLAAEIPESDADALVQAAWQHLLFPERFRVYANANAAMSVSGVRALGRQFSAELQAKASEASEAALPATAAGYLEMASRMGDFGLSEERAQAVDPLLQDYICALDVGGQSGGFRPPTYMFAADPGHFSAAVNRSGDRVSIQVGTPVASLTSNDSTVDVPGTVRVEESYRDYSAVRAWEGRLAALHAQREAAVSELQTLEAMRPKWIFNTTVDARHVSNSWEWDAAGNWTLNRHEWIEKVSYGAGTSTFADRASTASLGQVEALADQIRAMEGSRPEPRWGTRTVEKQGMSEHLFREWKGTVARPVKIELPGQPSREVRIEQVWRDRRLRIEADQSRGITAVDEWLSESAAIEQAVADSQADLAWQLTALSKNACRDWVVPKIRDAIHEKIRTDADYTALAEEEQWLYHFFAWSDAPLNATDRGADFKLKMQAENQQQYSDPEAWFQPGGEAPIGSIECCDEVFWPEF